ncbi:MAG: hypothetical protein ABL962_13890, partial [Fimbriimonadaceae bacterium]
LSYVVQAEGAKAEPAALVAIAKMADGGYRDALTLLEQALITSEDGITLERVYAQLGLIADESADAILLAIKDGDITQLVGVLSELSARGRDPRSILDSLMHRASDLTRAAYNVDMTGFDSTLAASLHEISANLTPSVLLRLRGQIAQIHKEIRDVSLPRIWMEAELIRCAMVNPLVSSDQARPAAVREVPEPQKQAAASVKPAPAEVTKEPQVELALTGDAIEQAQQVFAHLQRLLPEKVAHKNKLLASRVVEATDKVVTIVLGRKMDVDWFEDNPQRSGYLGKVLADAGHPGWTFVISGPKKAKVAKDAPAVELELTGTALVDAVKETFEV